MKNFAVEKYGNYTVVKLGQILTYNDAKEFEAEIDQLLLTPIHSIVDCEVVEIMSKDWVRSLLRLQLGLKKKMFGMRLVCLSNQLQNFLKKEGIDSAFSICSTSKEALADLGLGPKRTLDTEFVNPFLESTLKVLKVQAGIDAIAGKPKLKKNDAEFSGDISGIIGIVSDSFNGSVVISFPEKTFLSIMSGMLGDTFTQINKDIIDGAGEITNMIFGQAKVTLNEKGYGIKTALPSVVHGKNHILSSQTKGLIVVIPFESPSGSFFVEICLSP